MSTMTAQPSHLTINAAAQHADVTHSAIRKAIKRGQIEATKAGTRWLVQRESLDKYKRWRNIRKGGPITATVSIAGIELTDVRWESVDGRPFFAVCDVLRWLGTSSEPRHVLDGIPEEHVRKIVTGAVPMHAVSIGGLSILAARNRSNHEKAFRLLAWAADVIEDTALGKRQPSRELTVDEHLHGAMMGINSRVKRLESEVADVKQGLISHVLDNEARDQRVAAALAGNSPLGVRVVELEHKDFAIRARQLHVLSLGLRGLSRAIHRVAVEVGIHGVRIWGEIDQAFHKASGHNIATLMVASNAGATSKARRARRAPNACTRTDVLWAIDDTGAMLEVYNRIGQQHLNARLARRLK